jgi:hypothetical protein
MSVLLSQALLEPCSLKSPVREILSCCHTTSNLLNLLEIGGEAVTIVTDAAGDAITLASGAAGVITTFAGSVYTVAKTDFNSATAKYVLPCFGTKIWTSGLIIPRVR